MFEFIRSNFSWMDQQPPPKLQYLHDNDRFGCLAGRPEYVYYGSCLRIYLAQTVSIYDGSRLLQTAWPIFFYHGSNFESPAWQQYDHGGFCSLNMSIHTSENGWKNPKASQYDPKTTQKAPKRRQVAPRPPNAARMRPRNTLRCPKTHQRCAQDGPRTICSRFLDHHATIISLKSDPNPKSI